MATITHREIADYAGVSVSTVGMILAGRGERYSDVTCKRVLEAAAELGYTPNIAARSLKLNRSFLIGVLLHGSNQRIALDFLRGVQDAISSLEGYAPIVFSHGNPKEERDVLRRCLDRQVDGILANTSSLDPADLSEYRTMLGTKPVVEVFGHYLPGVPSVNIDNDAVGRSATEFLLELGHRRIAMITHDHYADSRDANGGPHFDAWERFLGYRDAMQAADLEPAVFTHQFDTQAVGYQLIDQFIMGAAGALAELLAHPSKPTAVICYSDAHAVGAVRACQDHGIPVPGRLAVVGYGDTEVSRVIRPALTTFRVPSYRVGAQAAKMLADVIGGKSCSVDNIPVASEFKVRESTAAPIGSEP